MESNVDQLVGMRLGTCQLIRQLGSGGMGTVYLARQNRPEREVAIKLLRTRIEGGSTAQREFLARFRREANVIARLDHVNIPPLYEYGEQDGIAYLVMPHYSGGSLRDLLNARGTLSPQEVLSYVEQAASALTYAHQQGVIHRDIKPANILFHADGRLVLVDFGIARIANQQFGDADVSLTSTGQFMGSVEYMAPEMIQAQPVDHRADIYELGVVLYQMLSGEVPFPGTSLFTIATKHLHTLPPSLLLARPALSPAIDAVVQKALAKRPDERYESALALAQALREAVSGTGSYTAQAPTQAAKHTPALWDTNWRDSQDVTQRALSNQQPPITLPPTEQIQPTQQDARHTPNPHSMPVLLPPTTQTPVYQQSSSSRYSEHGIQHFNELTHATVGPRTVHPEYPPATRRGEQNSMNPVLIGMVFLLVLALLGVGGTVLWSSGALRGLPLFAGITPGSTATTVPGTSVPPTATPTAEEQAKQVMLGYYEHINQKEYDQAYNTWGEEWQSKNPYEKYAQGFERTVKDTLTVDDVKKQDDGKFQVSVKLEAISLNDAGENVTQTFTGAYTLEQQGDGMRIVDGYLNPV